MKKIQIAQIVLIIFLLFIAFGLGFVAQDVRASGLNISKLVASLELLPQRLENARDGGSTLSDSKALPLIDTYSSVMDRLKADYYGGKVDERELTYSAIRGTLVALGDPFTRFMDPDEYKSMREDNEGTFTGIGAQLDTNKKSEVYIKEPLPDTPAERAGIKSNDVITHVDGKSIKGMDIEDVVKLIRGKEGTKVKLTIRRPGRAKTLDFVIMRQVVQFQKVRSRMVDQKNGIGYIRLYQFNEKSDEQFDKALYDLEKKHLKGLIFDLRGNPGGLLQVAVDIGSRFIESGPVVIIQERGGQRNPLYVEEDKHNHKRYPLVVLVDKSSASASEIVSGAIKDDKAGTLVGVTTFGKGRVQTIMPLQDGSAVAITTAKYLTPNGTDIHKKGIKPDIVVEQPDIDAVMEKLPEAERENYDPSDPKYDVQLSKAVDVLKVKLGLLPKSTLDKMMNTTAKLNK
ncbi:MAG: S41 family peptidase [Armatimonadota bacterium]